MTHQWFEDPETYLVDLRPGPGRRIGRITDAYSQWTLRYGAQFNLTEEYRTPATAPEDFNFILAFRELDGDHVGKVDAILSTDEAAPDPASAVAGPLRRLFIGRLPLYRQSVSALVPSVTAAGEDADTVTVDDWAPDPVPGIDPAKLVIVGVIDDAINVTNARFRDARGHSRVDAAWVQDAVYRAPPGPAPKPHDPAHRLFGRVLSNAEITAAIAAHPDDGEAQMRALGMIAEPGQPYQPTPLRNTISHGTHVADLAAGYDPAEDAVNRRILAVQLPIFASQDKSGVSLVASILAGSGFIFDRALAMSKAAGVPIPVVLNFSYGLGGGRRDGEDIVERALRAQSEAYRQAVAQALGVNAPPAVTVLPAGNGALRRSHARGNPASAGSATLETRLRVQPDDRTSSYVEFWVEPGTTDLSFTVASPSGLSHSFNVTLPANPADPGQVTLDNDYVLAMPQPGGGFYPGSVVGRFCVDCPGAFPGGDAAPKPRAWRAVLALAPTRALIAGRPVVEPGIWQVSCTAAGAGAGRVLAWIPYDETSLGFGIRGRQSYFDDPTYENALFDAMGDISVADTTDSIVRRDGTVTGIATRPAAGGTGNQVCVGAERWDIAGAGAYTAAGFSPGSNPHVLAPADNSRVLPGVLASSTLGATQLAMSGTSTATPVVTRIVADAAEAASEADYPTFSALSVIAGQAHPSPRPNGRPELASNDVVREERSELGTLDPPPALDAQVARHSVRKRVPGGIS